MAKSAINTPDFISDEEMNKLESNNSSPDFISDEEMNKFESSQVIQPTVKKENSLIADLGNRVKGIGENFGKWAKDPATLGNPNALGVMQAGELAGAANDVVKHGFNFVNKQVQNIPENIRDRLTMALPGGAGIVLGKRGLEKVLQTQPVQQSIQTGKNIFESADEKLKEISPGTEEMLRGAANMATGMPTMEAAKPALGMTANIVSKVPGFANKQLGRLAEELSGVSQEALRSHGLGIGEKAKAIEQAAGTQQQIGQKLVNALHNLDEYLPEKQIVDKALKEMPPVNINNAIKTLQKAKVPEDIAVADDLASNAKIDQWVELLANKADEAGNISAQDYRAIRKRMDAKAKDAFGKESSDYITALKQTRHTIANDLVDAAKQSGNTEYVDAMKAMADKLQKAEKVEQWLGKNATTQESRSQQFVSTLFGKNKAERQQAIKDLGEIFGQDFLDESKLASLAAELGAEGKPGWLPQQFTGRSVLGPAAAGTIATVLHNPFAAIPALALSSPKIAAKTLGAFDFAGQKIGKFKNFLNDLNEKDLSDLLSKRKVESVKAEVPKPELPKQEPPAPIAQPTPTKPPVRPLTNMGLFTTGLGDAASTTAKGSQLPKSPIQTALERIKNERGAVGAEVNSQVKSDNFKKWFGDWEKDPKNASKIVDEKGSPLVLYHGGDNEISDFSRGPNRGWSGGAFFTDDKDVAERYTTNQLGRGINRDKSDGKITSVFLDIKKPFYADGHVPWNEVKSTFTPDEIVKKVRNTPIGDYLDNLAESNDISPEELVGEYWDDLYQGLAVDMKIASEGDALANAPVVKFLHASGLYDDFMKRNKYDGIVYKDAEVGGNTYLPLSPTQIKSATSNSGAFNPTNPDIRGSSALPMLGLTAGTSLGGLAGGTALEQYLANKKKKK